MIVVFGYSQITPIFFPSCEYQQQHPWYHPISLLPPLPFQPSIHPNTIVKYPLSGNVGIGVCSPTAKLTVSNSENRLAFIVTSYYNNNLATFSVTREGYVGLYTSTPSVELDIRKENARIHLGTQSSYLELKANNNTHTIKSQRPLQINSTGQSVWFGSGDNIKVVIDGKLGIGTYSPQTRLHVNGGDFKLSGGHAYIDQGNLTLLQGNAFINKGNLNIGQGNAWINQGKLGIGVNPANVQGNYKLAVCGNVLAHEVRVRKNGWCDYVFEEDYPLKPWKEVVQYYKTHKHLPGVPSEKEVIEQGFNVGEMNKILLEKIEELYLYIEKLEQRVQELEEKH